MEYREIGTTGMKASILGMGTEHMDGKSDQIIESTLHAAIDQGINIMDVFMPGREVRAGIGKALKGRRDKVLLQGHIGSVGHQQQYDISRDLATCKIFFEDLLRLLQTDYIDFGMLFFIDTDHDLEQVQQNGIVAYAQELKKQGVIRAIGASSHNPVTARKLVETGVVDLLMFSINAAYDMGSVDSPVPEAYDLESAVKPDRQALYQLCASRGVGITVMKSLGAGRLLSAELSPFGRAMTAPQCIHYALSRPGVVSALVGYSSPEQIEDAMRYFSLPQAELDYAPVLAGAGGDLRGNCVYCNHCLPCPAQIDIAGVHRYLDIASLDPARVPPSVRQHYAALSAHGGDCLHCGSCEERCPFGVAVQNDMDRAKEIFGL